MGLEFTPGVPAPLLDRIRRELDLAMAGSGYCDLTLEVVSNQGVPAYQLNVNRKSRHDRSGRPLQEGCKPEIARPVETVLSMVAEGVMRIRAVSGFGSVLVEASLCGGLPRFRVVVSISFIVD